MPTCRIVYLKPIEVVVHNAPSLAAAVTQVESSFRLVEDSVRGLQEGDGGYFPKVFGGEVIKDKSEQESGTQGEI